MSQEGSHSVQCNYSWQAFPRSTAVSAICSSPWGDLWAGNSRGTIRSLPGNQIPIKYRVTFCHMRLWMRIGM